MRCARLCLALLLATGASLAQETPPNPVKQVALARLSLAHKIASDPELLKAVLAKNEQREAARTIQQRDWDWSENPASPLRKAMVQSPCSQRLRQLVKDDPVVTEVILMDAQGANVCISRETSDYWQGDEPKWQKTFGEGREIFIDEPAFDASSGTYAVQLSIPVAEASRRIGALTLTLKIRKDLLPDGGR